VSAELTGIIPSLPNRRASDADTPDHQGEFSLDSFYESMKRSRRERPRPVELVVHRHLIDESIPIPEEVEGGDSSINAEHQIGHPEEVTIHLVVTSIRQIMTDPPSGDESHFYRYPDFEAEGWLLAPPGQPLDKTIWVRCALRMDDSELAECAVFRLQPGEESGTEWTAGMS
jgi:hypothetical protein